MSQQSYQNVSRETFLSDSRPELYRASYTARLQASGIAQNHCKFGYPSIAGQVRHFIRAYCPVVEFGLIGATMHMVVEHVPVADIAALTEVCATLLEDYFG